MRILLTILAMLSLALPASAVQGFRSILLECNTPPGRTVRVQLDASLNIRYDYGLMEITGTHVYIQVPLANIARWTFSKDEVDGVVGTPDILAEDASVDVTGNIIEISGCTAPTEVVLCDSSGRVHFSQSVTDGCIINLDSLPRGIYILKVGTESYKIMTGR